MDNSTFLEYIHMMYGKSFSFENSPKADNGSEDWSISNTFKNLVENESYNMQDEFSYLKRFVTKHNTKLDLELIDSSLRRGIYMENPVLWKTLYFIEGINRDDLKEKYLFLEPELKKLTYAYTRIDQSTKSGRFAYLARSIGIVLRNVYKFRRFKVDKKIDETDFDILGIKGDTIYIGFYTNFNESKDYEYTIETYKGSIKDKKLDYMDKRPASPGDVLLNDYNAIQKILDIRDMDIWWVRN